MLTFQIAFGVFSALWMMAVFMINAFGSRLRLTDDPPGGFVSGLLNLALSGFLLAALYHGLIWAYSRLLS